MDELIGLILLAVYITAIVGLAAIVTYAVIKIFPTKRTSSKPDKPDKPENYHTVTIDLSGSGDETEVSLSQDNNADENARRESEKNWKSMLQGLKEYVEKASQA